MKNVKVLFGRISLFLNAGNCLMALQKAFRNYYVWQSSALPRWRIFSILLLNAIKLKWSSSFSSNYFIYFPASVAPRNLLFFLGHHHTHTPQQFVHRWGQFVVPRWSVTDPPPLHHHSPNDAVSGGGGLRRRRRLCPALPWRRDGEPHH